MMFALHFLAAAAPLQEQQSLLQEGPRALYYYTHIPKAAGSSFLMDMENSAVQMARCGDTQCFPGMQQVMPFQTMEENLEARANKWLAGECDVVGCEGTRAANQRVVFEHTKPSMVRDLLLLRDPVAIVVSDGSARSPMAPWDRISVKNNVRPG